MVVRTFLYQPFNIPSGSMKETLLVGDYLFVSKLSYGYSRYSFPFSLIPFEGRIFAAEPKRGDVVVFKLPRDNSTDYIKRVIGLPGDQIDVRGGILFINGKAVPRKRIGDFVDPGGRRSAAPIPAYQETLPNGVKYTVLDAEAERPVRQRRALQGAGRALLHDGRQPRQLHRQPRLAGASATCRSRTSSAAPRSSSSPPPSTSRRPSAGGALDLAVRHPLEPVLQAGSLTCAIAEAAAHACAASADASSSPRDTASAKIQGAREALGHRFKNQKLIEMALTHASMRGGKVQHSDNERLEFLGDRVLGLVIAELLSERIPSASEGELARRYNRLVRGGDLRARRPRPRPRSAS